MLIAKRTESPTEPTGPYTFLTLVDCISIITLMVSYKSRMARIYTATEAIVYPAQSLVEYTDKITLMNDIDTIRHSYDQRLFFEMPSTLLAELPLFSTPLSQSCKRCEVSMGFMDVKNLRATIKFMNEAPNIHDGLDCQTIEDARMLAKKR